MLKEQGREVAVKEQSAGVINSTEQHRAAFWECEQLILALGTKWRNSYGVDTFESMWAAVVEIGSRKEGKEWNVLCDWMHDEKYICAVLQKGLWQVKKGHRSNNN